MMMVGWMTYAQNDVVLMTKTALFINLGLCRHLGVDMTQVNVRESEKPYHTYK